VVAIAVSAEFDKKLIVSGTLFQKGKQAYCAHVIKKFYLKEVVLHAAMDIDNGHYIEFAINGNNEVTWALDGK